MPRAPLHDQGVTLLVVVSGTTSAGVTPLSSLVRAHAPVLNPPSASVVSLDSGSVQVAISPCWEEDLPDVVSAHPSLRAWTPTPAALEVRLPVSSLTTSAFPSFGLGRRSTLYRTATSVRRAFRGCSHSLMCRPAGVLATQIAPTDTATPYGSRDFSIRASRGLLPPHAPDMLAVRIGQLTAEDFHLIRCAALSAAPRTLRFTCTGEPDSVAHEYNEPRSPVSGASGCWAVLLASLESKRWPRLCAKPVYKIQSHDNG